MLQVHFLTCTLVKNTPFHTLYLLEFHFRFNLWEKQIPFFKGICKLLYWTMGNKERCCAVYCLMTHQPWWQVIILHGNEEQVTHWERLTNQTWVKGSKLHSWDLTQDDIKSAARRASEPTGVDLPALSHASGKFHGRDPEQSGISHIHLHTSRVYGALTQFYTTPF